MTSLKEVERLFERGHNSSVQAWPLRAVYRCPEGSFVSKSGSIAYKSGCVVPKSDCIVPKSDCAATTPPAKVLISVAKKRLRHAVDRNRAKRQTREAYRLHKQPLVDALAAKGVQMHVAFVWLATEPVQTAVLFNAMSRIVSTIVRRMQPDTEKNRPFVQSADAKQDNT
ncbi:MAG: ribonuclease P protein component [Prevotellaceae bacterium]|nr:ribonuclease P protein component [Prevotellaceae bacterium]